MIAFLLACASPPASVPPAPEPDGLFRAHRGPAGPAPTAPHPSLVLVVGCTVRADQVGAFGGPPGVTPFLDGLAADGARFADAIAAAPWTRAAAVALLTGSHALSVGMADPGPGADARALRADVVTLAEHLAGAGFRTVGVSTNPNVAERWGLAQGFESWREPTRRWTDDGVKIGGPRAVAEALEALGPGDGRPTFLFVLLVDAHAPFDATDAERAALADPAVPPLVVTYRASLRRFDEAARLLSDRLRERLGDDVVFAVASDHGEGLGFPEHHGRAHGRFLAPSAVRAVALVRGPGVPAGAVVDGPTSMVDLAPTLAELVGVPGLPAEGVSRAAAIRGEAAPASAEAFADTWFQDVDRAAIYTRSRACQIDLSGAPPTDGFVDGCFDRVADPAHAARLDDPALTARVLAFRAAREGVGPAAPAPADPEVDAQLEALGYADRASAAGPD